MNDVAQKDQGMNLSELWPLINAAIGMVSYKLKNIYEGMNLVRSQRCKPKIR